MIDCSAGHNFTDDGFESASFENKKRSFRFYECLFCAADSVKEEMLKKMLIGIILALLLIPAHINSEECSSEESFRVLELFTSQGCASCPSADSLLKKVYNPNKKIFAVSLHVDYWDYLGWKDPYARKENSEKQKEYFRKMNWRVYTPQIVLNGQDHFIGSDEDKIIQNLNTKLQNRKDSRLNLSLSRSFNELKVNFKTICTSSNSVLRVHLLRKNVKNRVSNGENAGLFLEHINVSEGYQEFDLSKGGSGLARFSVKTAPSEYRILAYIQNRNSNLILAADETE